ncbi:MAG TPA: hypothetical protein VFU33_11515 [Gaiellaceae bacterium]|nr:hypothetical protein [Gaiellaceae bacterium]
MSHLRGCAGFWLWALVGAGAVLGTISLGPLAWIPLAVFVFLLSRRPEWGGGPVLLGLVAGAGVPLLVVAGLQWNAWHERIVGDNTAQPLLLGRRRTLFALRRDRRVRRPRP